MPIKELRLKDISIQIPEEGDDRLYHHPHPLGDPVGTTLCGWVNAKHSRHRIIEHPVSCNNCRQFVSIIKTYSGPYENIE